MVGELHVDRPAVGVAGESKLDAELCGAMKAVRIVRKKNVGHVAANERFDIRKTFLSLAAGRALALVIHTDKIELRTFESNLNILLAQKFHAGLGVEISRFFFHARVNFMIASATPDAERSMQ